MSKLRLGVIGTGSVVREIYQNLYYRSGYSHLLSVEGAADPNREALTWFCDRFAIPRERRFDSYEDIFASLFEGIGAAGGAALTDSITTSLFGEGGMQEWFQNEFAKMKLFGGEGGAFGDMTGGQGAMMGLAGAGMVYGATQQQSRGAGMMQGAMGGAL